MGEEELPEAQEKAGKGKGGAESFRQKQLLMESPTVSKVII